MSCTRFNFPIINYNVCCPTPPTTGGGDGDTTIIESGMIVATTLAGLMATDPIPDNLEGAFLFGIDAPGDSAMISYYWDAASVDAHDGIQTIKFDVTDAGDPGRLKQEGNSAP